MALGSERFFAGFDRDGMDGWMDGSRGLFGLLN